MSEKNLFPNKSRFRGSVLGLHPSARRTHRVPTSLFAALILVTTLVAGCDDNIVASDAVSDVAPDAASEVTLGAAAKGAHGAPGTITTFASFDPFAVELPESIAVDRHGNVYVSMTRLGEIRKLDPSGSFVSVVATFPLEGFFGVGGLRFDTQGDLYAANGTSNDDVRGVYKITHGGEKERIAGTSDIAQPNDVAISPNGTVYITDSRGGAVWRYTPGGQAELWVQDEALEGNGAFGLGFPLGANGIAFVSGHGAGKGLMVANTEKGQLVYVPILADKSAGQPTVVVADPSLFGLDGIRADVRGNVYGAVNFGNKVVRISRDGTEISEIASGPPLDFPGGVAFGTGREQHTLFIANFAFISPPEAANPAVLSVRVGPPGHK